MKPFATHQPGKVLADLAISLALGGDCLADASLLRAEPGLFGPVGSEATISRTVSALAKDADRVIAAINTARAAARARAWHLAGGEAASNGINDEHPLIVDLDATLVTAHSEKENTAPTFKRGFGFHPLCAFLDHGQAGTGEPLAMLLRAGNAGSNTAADHIAVTAEALRQLPGIDRRWPGRTVLIRTDGAGGTKEFLTWLVKRNLSYSVGFTLPGITPELYALIPEGVWSPALDSDPDGGVRDGAAVAEITDLLAHHGLLAGWPNGMRVIIRRERPHPGAQLRFDDVDGYRITGFATNTTHGQLQALELRHRRRARCEDRIRCAKDTGLSNLPLKSFAANRIWCHLVMLAGDLTAWMQLLAFAKDPARRWEPKRLRHRLFAVPAVLARHARQTWLRIKTTAPWTPLVVDGHARLAALGPPG